MVLANVIGWAMGQAEAMVRAANSDNLQSTMVSAGLTAPRLVVHLSCLQGMRKGLQEAVVDQEVVQLGRGMSWLVRISGWLVRVPKGEARSSEQSKECRGTGVGTKQSVHVSVEVQTPECRASIALRQDVLQLRQGLLEVVGRAASMGKMTGPEGHCAKSLVACMEKKSELPDNVVEVPVERFQAEGCPQVQVSASRISPKNCTLSHKIITIGTKRHRGRWSTATEFLKKPNVGKAAKVTVVSDIEQLGQVAASKIVAPDADVVGRLALRRG